MSIRCKLHRTSPGNEEVGDGQGTENVAAFLVPQCETERIDGGTEGEHVEWIPVPP